jgi:hypothetical protein
MNRITALLAFNEHLSFFDTSQTSAKVRSALTRGQERNTETSEGMHIRKKKRIREFLGHSEYLKSQKIL